MFQDKIIKKYSRNSSEAKNFSNEISCLFNYHHTRPSCSLSFNLYIEESLALSLSYGGDGENFYEWKTWKERGKFCVSKEGSNDCVFVKV